MVGHSGPLLLSIDAVYRSGIVATTSPVEGNQKAKSTFSADTLLEIIAGKLRRAMKWRSKLIAADDPDRQHFAEHEQVHCQRWSRPA